MLHDEKWSRTLLLMFCFLRGIEGSTPMAQFVEMVHFAPTILYECFRNGTTIEPRGSVNVTFFFDGTESPPDEMSGDMYYSTRYPPGEIIRKPLSMRYSAQGDNTTVLLEGSKAVVRIVQLYKNGIQLTSEIAPFNTRARKIYDIEASCSTAKELQKQLCQKPCDLVPSREF